MSDFPGTALELQAALRSGELSSRAATEHYIDRIAEQPELGAFVTVTAEQALAEAEAADARFAALSAEERAIPGALPALHGLPIAHKDLVEVAGAPTSRGTAALPTAVAEHDHLSVAVLRAAGTVSLGKTQVPELGLNAYSENLVAAPARNPLDPERTPGGSSGGSAAAVAAGLLPVAPGSDGGGSIRIPALACGLIGLKPGLGSVPSDVIGGPFDDFGAPKLVVSGPLARTVADAAMLYDAMTGSPAPSLPAVRRADELTGLRIGMSTASPFESAHPTPISAEAHAAYEAAAAGLIARGHHVEEAHLAYDPRYTEVFTSCWMAGLSLLALSPEAEARLTPFTRLYRECALATPRETHLAAAEALRGIAAGLRAEWARYDVVLTPGLATPPPRIGAFMNLHPDADYRAQCEWTPFTSMVNVSGLPAIAVPTLTVPNPHGAGQLSMGAQLIGHPGSEPLLLQLAAQLTSG